MMRIPVLDKGFVELIDHLGDDHTVVAAARVSYLQESKGEEKDKKLIQYMLKHQHSTPFEHVTFQLRIKAPVVTWWQLIRHRTFSFNLQSGRYTEFDEDEYYTPGEWRVQSKSNKQASEQNLFIERLGGSERSIRDIYESVFEFCFGVYEEMLKSNVAKEQARLVLPFAALYYTGYITADLRNLLHFIELRNTQEAQYEIRVYAEAVENIIKDICPWTYESWKEINTVSARGYTVQ